jgi:LysR family transcriptional regulator, nitrogen assimilation regulatory protein
MRLSDRRCRANLHDPMQLRHLRYFVRIVEAGSFSRAAATIHVAQPALSQQIAELEEELGVSLLHRSARGVRPTAAGETLYREAAAILQQMEQLPGKVRSTGGEMQGAVNLGMTSTLATFLSGPLMEACRTALPKVALRFITGHSLLIASRIEARSLDFGVVFEDEHDLTPGFLRQPLFRQRLFFVRRKNDPDQQDAISVTNLAELPLVLPAHPNVTRVVLDRAFAAAGLTPNIAAEADTLLSFFSAVQSGTGHAILPTANLSGLLGNTVLTAIPIDPPIWLTASILLPADSSLSSAAEGVRDLFARFVARWLADGQMPGMEWKGDAQP